MNVKLTNMPTSIRGFTQITAEPEGDFATIVLNSKLSHEANMESCRHEEQHLSEDDFNKACADDIERESHDRKKVITDYIGGSGNVRAIGRIRRKDRRD